jgi:chromosome segregation ATPase
MNRITALFGRTNASKTPDTTNDTNPVAAAAAPSQGRIDEAGLESLGSRIGAANEGLRGMMIEASRKFEELDALKALFGDIVGPVRNTLRELEQEKSQNASLRNVLADTRGQLDALRTEHAQTEKARAALVQDIAALRQDLMAAQQDAQNLESIRAELSESVNAQRAQIAQLERQLAAESGQRQSIQEAHRVLSAQAQESDRRNVRLEADNQNLQEKLLLTEEEKQSLQASLDQSIAETARVARRLSETETQLAAARNRIAELEKLLAEAETDRNALQARFDEANERHQTETATLANRLGSLQSRAGASEKLLSEARQHLAARSEELRDLERKAADAEAARIAAEKRQQQLLAANETLERQIAELTQSRATLVERSGAVNKTLKLREAALARAEEKIAALSERVKQLETDNRVLREAEEKRVEELSTALNRERMARAVAEGALASSRRDFARVQQEIATLNAQRLGKTGQPAETPAALAKRVKSNFAKVTPPTTVEAAAKTRAARKSAADEPIVKN